MQEHKPVMLKEVLYFLDIKPGKRYIDATVGGGGHSEAILTEGGEVLGIDQDPRALDKARKRLKACPASQKENSSRGPGVFKLKRANFSEIKEVASAEDWKGIYGILFDLGFASFQVDSARYGLSFAKDGPLDMRLDPSLGVTAADLVNSLPERQLYELFKNIGQEDRASSIARSVVSRRSLKHFETTSELRKVVEEVYGKKTKPGIHPATKIFMALRIAVNSEFENLGEGLVGATGLLVKTGRLVVLSYHSGEDRLVKNFFKDKEKEGVLKVLTKKPVTPSEQEIRENPRARSARLRAAEKL